MKKKHDVTKLPKWAQTEIYRLEGDIHYYCEKMKQMLHHEEESNVLIPYFKDDMQDQYLPKDTRVQFLLPHLWSEARPGHIEVRHSDEHSLDIHASQPIWIEPGASNCCVIRFRDKASIGL